MSVDLSIERWTRDVALRQWSRDDGALSELGAVLPEPIARERSLAEVHRLDLSLFVVFEEAALRVSGALVRRAPDAQAMAFAAQQTLDPARLRRHPHPAAAQVSGAVLRGRRPRRLRRGAGADQPGAGGDGLSPVRLRGALLGAGGSLPGPPDRQRLRRRDPPRRLRRHPG